MNGPGPQWQIAECMLPGLSPVSAAALGRRVRQELAGLPGLRVSFLGSLLMPGDEVLLCLFAGTEAEVRAVRRRKERREARAMLGEALSAFEALGAPIWATGRERN